MISSHGPLDDRGRLDLARRLFALGAVQFGAFTLKSGARSPVYLDLRLLVSDPPLLADAARAYAAVLATLSYDRIAAIPYAALPIGTAVSLATGHPMIYPRKEVKAYGTGKAVEGRFEPGDVAVLVDDVISSGASKIEAINALEAAGLVVRDVVVLVDRQATGAADLASAGYRLHGVLPLTGIAEDLGAAGQLPPERVEEVRAYVQASAAGK
jgi:uridine monophosphate synthetase